MPNAEFTDKSECQGRLRLALHIDAVEAEVDGQFLDGLLDGFCDACEEPPAEAKPGVFRLQWNKWIIRNEDLKLFSTIKDVLIPMASVGYALPGIGPAGVTALVLALIDLLRKVLVHGCELNERQMQIVSVLKANNRPMSGAEIFKQLPATESEGWTVSVVEKQLEMLQAVVSQAGLKEFVEQRPDGTWWLQGV